MGGGWKSGAPASLQDLPPPGLAGSREPLDEAVGVLPQAEAHQQHAGPARPRESANPDHDHVFKVSSDQEVFMLE